MTHEEFAKEFLYNGEEKHINESAIELNSTIALKHHDELIPLLRLVHEAGKRKHAHSQLDENE